MDKVKVRMLRNERGSQDGFTVEHFEKDETYAISKSLADVFVENDAAELANDNAPVEPIYDTGNVYERDGAIVVAGDKNGERTWTKVEELTEEERGALIDAGKLNVDGSLPERKSEGDAPKNKAIKNAPKNKATPQTPAAGA